MRQRLALKDTDPMTSVPRLLSQSPQCSLLARLQPFQLITVLQAPDHLLATRAWCLLLAQGPPDHAGPEVGAVHSGCLLYLVFSPEPGISCAPYLGPPFLDYDTLCFCGSRDHIWGCHPQSPIQHSSKVAWALGTHVKSLPHLSCLQRVTGAGKTGHMCTNTHTHTHTQSGGGGD